MSIGRTSLSPSAMPAVGLGSSSAGDAGLVRGVDHLLRAGVDAHLVEHGVDRLGHRRRHVHGLQLKPSELLTWTPRKFCGRRPVVDAAEPDRPAGCPAAPPTSTNGLNDEPGWRIGLGVVDAHAVRRRRSRPRSRRSSGRPTPARCAGCAGWPLSTRVDRVDGRLLALRVDGQVDRQTLGVDLLLADARAPPARPSPACRCARRRRRGCRRRRRASAGTSGNVSWARSAAGSQPWATIPSSTKFHRSRRPWRGSSPGPSATATGWCRRASPPRRRSGP